MRAKAVRAAIALNADARRAGRARAGGTGADAWRRLVAAAGACLLASASWAGGATPEPGETGRADEPGQELGQHVGEGGGHGADGVPGVPAVAAVVEGVDKGAVPLLAGADAAEARPAARASAAEIAALVADLDSPEWLTRARATDALRDDPSIDLSDLESALLAGGLSAEQTARLEAACLERFSRSAKPGLGVQYDARATAEPGIRISLVMPNFPAAQFLVAGDVLVEADGEVIRNFVQFQGLILRHQPGETMDITVLRLQDDGVRTPQRLQVPLGRFEDLSNNPPDESALRSGLKRRMERLARELGASPSPEVVAGSALSPADWLKAEGVWSLADPRSVAVGLPPPRSISALNPAGPGSSRHDPFALQRIMRHVVISRLGRDVRNDALASDVDADLAAYRVLASRVAELNGEIAAARSAAGPAAARAADLIRERQNLIAQLDELQRGPLAPPGG